ncbi:MAG: sodium-translocating pyrophosphatase [Deltaproteobacteria bacterium]|nr:sodium-translocating pyrophosphatase [Deltaproteobacteria bacterium]MDQ3298543.1 sodium-translocating pyrophosphatase [Myxococcota bacterium]
MTSLLPWLNAAAETAGQAARPHSEAQLTLPDFHQVHMFGISGWNILAMGLAVCAIGLLFGLMKYQKLKNLPVHKAMLEISELIYETCKTYLKTQGKFIFFLWLPIATIIVVYFAVLEKVPLPKVAAIAAFSVVGILGSVLVAFFGIRVNNFANSRAAFASLRGKPYHVMAIPLEAGMSIGTVLISVELLLMLSIMLFLPGDYAGPCFIGFAVGESLGAAALRIAGGIFTKIADIGSDLMKIVFNIKEDDARNPGVIADCTGDNAGDSVGPTADGFETYGVTGVALITFLLVALPNIPGLPIFAADGTLQDPGEFAMTVLLVWLFGMRIVMILASVGSYLINEALTKAKYLNADKMDFEHPLTVLVWLTSLVSVGLTFAVSYAMIGMGDSALPSGLWWKLSIIISCGTLAGAIIPELVKIFTSVNSGHVREVVTASKEGGASLNILAGLTAGNFSGYWMGLTITALMAVAYYVSSLVGMTEILYATNLSAGLEMSPFACQAASTVFAFGLVAFGFLGMGPVTIAVDSYGPVTDNAQSVYELSMVESIPNVEEQIKKDFGFRPEFERAKMFLEENDGAGNTFKATAKPVLIGTAVVGAATMIFALIMLVTNGLKPDLVANLSMIHPPFLLGLIVGGAIIYWFTGASTQAVSTGAYRAVEFIKANIKLDGTSMKASVSDSNKVVEICTLYAQKGMVNIFLVIFFTTLSFACIEPYFFIGYLISMALFGLYQAIFMANAGGAWDNAKKIVETELRAKNTPLHEACVVGDTVGDPFKDTSSVALNPVIKFTTLFGVLAVGLALQLTAKGYNEVKYVVAGVSLAISMYFAWRSFYRMRIGDVGSTPLAAKASAVVAERVEKHAEKAEKHVDKAVEKAEAKAEEKKADADDKAAEKKAEDDKKD